MASAEQPTLIVGVGVSFGQLLTASPLAVEPRKVFVQRERDDRTAVEVLFLGLLDESSVQGWVESDVNRWALCHVVRVRQRRRPCQQQITMDYDDPGSARSLRGRIPRSIAD